MKSMELLKKFITTELISDPAVIEISESAPLIESGILDSMGIMKLLDFIETAFSVKISDGDIIPENFINLEAICALIDHKSVPCRVN